MNIRHKIFSEIYTSIMKKNLPYKYLIKSITNWIMLILDLQFQSSYSLGGIC